MGTENRDGRGRIAAGLSRALSRIAYPSRLRIGTQKTSSHLLPPAHMAQEQIEEETGRQYVLSLELPDVSLNELYGQFGSISRDSDHVVSRESVTHPSTISAFPTELLVDIFALLSRDDPPVFPDPGEADQGRRLGWLVVTHVCRRGRDIAVGTPTLWLCIDFSMGPPWVPLMLARANGLPVTICKILPYARLRDKECFPSELELLRAHLFHTEWLVLVGDPAQLAVAVQCLDVPVPLLHHLCLYFLQSSLALSSEFSLGPFFSGHHPRLHSVSLNNFRCRWPINLPIPSLVNLYIRFFVTEQCPLAPHLGGLLDFLESVPTLQFLRVSELEVGGNENAEPWAGHSVVKLPHLECLEIECGRYFFLGLINGIDLPPGVLLDLSIKVSFLGRIPSVICAILPILDKHMQTLPPIQTLVLNFAQPVDHKSHWGMEVIARGVCLQGEDASAAPEERLVFRLAGDRMPTTSRRTHKLTFDVFDTLPLSSVCTLFVASMYWSSAWWLLLFLRCSALEHIHATNDAAVTFVHALPPPELCHVPCLKTVALSGVDFGERGGGVSLGDDLIAWLMRRREMHMELQRLRLVSCVVSPEQIMAISESVGTVEISLGEGVEEIRPIFQC
ncbi:hypothetical protein BV25DRAFT_168253 [Artomyces pyxidatus]|uniref:Uncharacterized protein n=1 Tax=Artomyces pyxidatus TaxID=48021 RepID=A0ACB8SI39_9AGAM|nr:hypothetical protein BV25DRAFT_168253 [Artomyces pyxidatus]